MAPTLAKTGRRTGRRFYVGVGLFLIALSIAGFGPSLLDQSKRNGPPTPLVLVHGALAAMWLLLFLTQAILIATGRKEVHRRLGVAGAILAFAVVVLGCMASIETQRRGMDLSGDLVRAGGGEPFTPEGILFSLNLFFYFGVLVAAALWYRHRPEVHKRLMVLAIIVPLGGEPVGHLIGHLVAYLPGLQGAVSFITLPIVLILYAVHAIHDRITEGRIHPVSLWVPIAMFVGFNLQVFVLQSSSVGLRFSEWLIRSK